MTPELWQAWSLNPWALGLLAALGAAYWWLASGRWQRGGAAYAAALGLLALVEFSPLHYLGMHALFSAHMVAHVLLLLLAGPLLVLGLPPHPTPRAAAALHRFSTWLGPRAWLGWGAGVGIMWLLHVPAVFDASFAGMDQPWSPLPLLHPALMLVAGALFSWPLFGPVAAGEDEAAGAGARLHPLAGVLYLFTACVACSLLGMLITFAPFGTYLHYYLAANPAAAAAPHHLVAAVPFGLSLLEDQQAAGLIMWVPCCLLYLGGCLYLIGQYFSLPAPPAVAAPGQPAGA
ncbi:MAG: cytochrome c oxidase assembly protein [Janthinobacterium lividum]